MSEQARLVRPDDPSALELAVEAIRADRLVAVPTETVYGLACALTDAAVDRLVEAKGRDVGKGITLLVDELADAARFIADLPAAKLLAARFWPGPLTMVVPLQPGVELPYAVTGGTYAVGVPVPAVSGAWPWRRMASTQPESSVITIRKATWSPGERPWSWLVSWTGNSIVMAGMKSGMASCWITTLEPPGGSDLTMPLT